VWVIIGGVLLLLIVVGVVLLVVRKRRDAESNVVKLSAAGGGAALVSSLPNTSQNDVNVKSYYDDVSVADAEAAARRQQHGLSRINSSNNNVNMALFKSFSDNAQLGAQYALLPTTTSDSSSPRDYGQLQLNPPPLPSSRAAVSSHPSTPTSTTPRQTPTSSASAATATTTLHEDEGQLHYTDMTMNSSGLNVVKGGGGGGGGGGGERRLPPQPLEESGPQGYSMMNMK
jgi:hypothetical protein